MMNYFIGGGLTLFGIFLALVLRQPHFYAVFSVGVFIIFLEVYKSIVHKKLFSRWDKRHYVLFWATLFIVGIGIDLLGTRLGYWQYPSYTSSFDEVIKYIFEWSIALMYVTLSFFIGLALFKKHKVSLWIAIPLSLIIFVIPIGLITEFLNHIALSWVVLKTPITDFSIAGYFIVFQTVGYWVMALIPWGIYELINDLSL